MKKLALIVVIALPALAMAEPDALGTLFPLRAPIATDGAGLGRLELPAEVIRVCRADLSDVRIIGADGREIPYVVDNRRPRGVVTEVSYGAIPEILEASHTRMIVDRVPVYQESYVVEIPDVPPEVPAWDLVFDVQAREFVARLDITVIEQDGRRTPVDSGGSIFRLRSARSERLRVRIPTREKARLQIALESQDRGYLQPRLRLEASRHLPDFGSVGVGLEVIDVRRVGRNTEIVVNRPRGIVPKRLTIATGTDTFHRTVTVWDEGPGAEADPLGSATVLRIAAFAPVQMLEIPLRPPRGHQLRLVIEDGDSPPLETIAITAGLPRPVLVFSLPPAAQPASLFFGGGRAHRPRYDLASLEPDRLVPASGDAVTTALAVLDPSRARTATLGPMERNPSYDPAPVLAFAMHPGAELDPRPYSHRRLLDVAPSAEGLARLRLEPDDLAVARPDLADLRITDEDGRQWAYLRRDAAASVEIPVVVEDHEVKDRESSYAIRIDGGPIRVHRLDLEVSAPYFDRDFTLHGVFQEQDEQELARGRLVRRAGDPRPISLSFPATRIVGFRLEVVDGDDAPLAFGRIETRANVPDIYLAAEPGEYNLLIGHPEAAAPVYELERVRSAILAVPAAEIDALPLAPNPEFRASSRLGGSDATQKIVLWTALGLAVVVLLVLTLRAAGSEGTE